MPERHEIREDDLTGPGVVGLLRAHLVFVAQHSPPGSIHALDSEALRGDDSITFWGVWDGGVIAGCGALKALDAENGELKSMITAEPYRRRVGDAQAPAVGCAPTGDSTGLAGDRFHGRIRARPSVVPAIWF